MDVILNIIPKILKTEQCKGQRLAPELRTHETDPNCTEKALKTELTLKAQLTEGWSEFAA